MSPLPVYSHQKVVQEVFRRLCSEIVDKGLGEVIVSPFDVYLDETNNAIQPDIIVVLTEHLRIIDPSGHIHGVPDILVEILSPSNKTMILFLRKNFMSVSV